VHVVKVRSKVRKYSKVQFSEGADEGATQGANKGAV
jgi:hypothetical protein